ncbi:hypothetical protein L7F22_031647 [Adiantum nelumboides]|nr:hypothetical protein [Adiantum nelumboides]
MDARDIARLKERKIRYKLQQREADQEEEGMAPVSPTNAPAAHRGQGNQDQQELLSRITHQLEDLSVHLVRGGRAPPPNQEQARGPRRQAQEYHCYNCGENCHVQPQPQQPPPPIAPIPPLPVPENRAVNVISLDAKVKVEEEEKGKSLPKDKGKAKVEDVDAMPIKRARQEEAAMSETGERRKSKKNGESSSKKKSKTRRKLTIKDFALGESSQPYNLVDDVSVQGPKITWPQLLHLAPKVRRKWTKMVSTRRVKTKAMGLVSGSQICVMTEQTMHRLGLKVNAPAPCKAKMANNSKVKCLGVINGLKIKFVNVTMEGSLSLVLKHWLTFAYFSKWIAPLQESNCTMQVRSLIGLAGVLTHESYQKKTMFDSLKVEQGKEVVLLGEACSPYLDGAYTLKLSKAAIGIAIYNEKGAKLFGMNLVVDMYLFFDAFLSTKQVKVPWICGNQSLVSQDWKEENLKEL